MVELKFFEYLSAKKNLVVSKLIRGVRRNAGLLVNSHNVPDRSYTNQSESTNAILSAKKVALGYTKKEDITKLQFIRHVWEECVKEQDLEIEKCVHGQSDRFRLSDDVRQLLLVKPEKWFTLTKSQKDFYTNVICKYSTDDINNKKRIRIPDEATAAEEAAQNLSTK